MQQADFPLKSVDAQGKPLAPGDNVIVVSVASCARGLPQQDQDRLFGLVGEKRRIIEIDRFGFVWLSFSLSEPGADFCLLPAEVVGE
jgi:hypothetical protein